MMSTLSFLGSPSGPEFVFLLMLAQFAVALWLSYRLYREEPNWQTLSMLGSLLLVGMPGFVVMRVLRAACRGYVEEVTRPTEPEGN